MLNTPDNSSLSNSSEKKNSTFIIVFAIIILIFIAHSIFLSVIADDSFIGFHYAKNFVNGFGLVWNIGEKPIEGYTNFLWIILCSLGLLLNLELTTFSQFLGILSSLITLIYVYKIGKNILGFKTEIALIPCLLLAVSGPFATWASSGMETNLFTLFVVGSFCYELDFWLYHKRKSLILLFLFLLLAALTRPEGLGIFLILFVFHLIKTRESKTSSFFKRSILAAFIFFIIPFVVYFIWRFAYFGNLLPNTYFAKTGGSIFQWLRGLAYVIYFCIHFLLSAVPLLIILLWISIDKLKTKGLIKEVRLKINSGIRYYALFLILISCLLYSVYIIYVGGDYMAMYRFFVPILPFIYLLLADCYNILRTNASNIKTRNFASILLILFILGTIVQSTPADTLIFEKSIRQHGQYHGVLFERWHSNRLTVIGKFFNSYKKSSDECIATDAIGAISYYSGLKVDDYHGLADPYIAHLEPKNLGKGFPGHEKKDFAYTLSKNPTFLMFNRDLTKRKAEIPKYPNSIEPIIKSDYELVSVWLKDELNNDSGFFNFFQRKNR